MMNEVKNEASERSKAERLQRVVMYRPCQFDRKEYLDLKTIFETIAIDDFESELCEFNDNIEDIAAELSYTRYRLAKAEKLLRERDGGTHDFDCKSNRVLPCKCNCQHDEVLSFLGT